MNINKNNLETNKNNLETIGNFFSKTVEFHSVDINRNNLETNKKNLRNSRKIFFQDNGNQFSGYFGPMSKGRLQHNTSGCSKLFLFDMERQCGLRRYLAND